MSFLLAILGLSCLGCGLWLRARTRADKAGRGNWVVVAGRVLTSGVSQQKMPGEGGGYFNRFGARYGYTVAGTEHSGYVFSDKGENHSTLGSRYPMGAALDVFYDPAKPQRSEVRDPLVAMGGWSAGLGPLSWCLMGIGGFFSLVGIAMLAG